VSRIARGAISCALVIGLGLVAGCGNGSQNAGSETLLDANKLYQSGDFEGARDAYAQEVERGYDGARVLYNLANSCFRCGRIGEAIAYYQRAARIAPRDRDIRDNLRRAYHERSMGEPAPPAMWLHAIGRRLTGSFTLSELALTAAALYWLAVGLTVMRMRNRRRSRWQGRLLVAAVLCAIAMSGLATARWWTYHHTGAAVVIADKTEIRSGPGESFEIVQRVGEGLMVRIARPDGEWLQVVAESGARGWLPTAAVAFTQPQRTGGGKA
jgi:hypothetical protein